MTARRIAGIAAAYAAAWSIASPLYGLASDQDVAWAVSLVFSLVWSALLLTAAACGVATRALAALGGVVALAQWALALYTFNSPIASGWLWYLPVMVLSAGAVLSHNRNAVPA